MDFELLALDKRGNIKILHFKGAYLICNNGYLNWSCTVPPFGVSNDINEIRWSKWLESVRKDVEFSWYSEGQMEGIEEWRAD